MVAKSRLWPFLCCLVLMNLSFAYSIGITDSHDDGDLSGWSIYGDRGWSEVNGIATPANNSNFEGFLINDFNCQNDGIFEVDITSDTWSGNFGGVVFRWSSPNNYYFVSVKPGGLNSGILYFCKNTMNTASGSVVRQDLNMATTFKLKIEISGSNFKFYIDNNYAGEANDAGNIGGKIGYGYFAQWNDYIDYDNLVWQEDAANNAPTDINISKSTILEQKPVGSLVGNFSTIDPDLLDTHTYSLVIGEGADDNDKFTIVGSELRTSQIFDYPSDTQLSIRVKSEDNGTGNLSFEKNIIINIRELEDFSQWSYSQRISFNTTEYGANVMATVSNFPLLVKLTSQNFNFNQAMDNGLDIRFADPDGTPLSYEIELWDIEVGLAYIWVNVPQIDGNSNSDFITMYTGNSQAEDKSSSGAVFEANNGFEGVWHLGEDSAGISNTNLYKNSVTDLMHGNDFISSTNKDGQAGLGQQFNGLTDYIGISGTTTDNLEKLTLSCWVKPSQQSSWADMISKEDGDYWNAGFGLRRSDNDRFVFTVCDGGKQELTGAEASFIDDSTTWYHVAGSYDGTTMRLFIDGVEVLSGNSASGSIIGTSQDINLGRRVSTAANEFYGSIDEMRFSKVARSSEWIKLSYENQKSGSSLTSMEQVELLPIITIKKLVTSVFEESTAVNAIELHAALGIAQTENVDVSINLEIFGTATNGADYSFISNVTSVTIPVDSLTGKVFIPITPIDDEDDEGNEMIVIRVLADSTYIIDQPDSAVVYIQDADKVTAPEVVTDPQSVTIYAGDVYEFNVAVTGTAPLSYQWLLNDQIIPGANDSIYVIPPVSLADNGSQIKCIVSNVAGADTSNIAIISVVERPQAPKIINHPASINAVIGDTVKFYTVVTGDRPFQFQWFTDSGVITDATDSILEVGPVVLSDNSASYYCQVSNSVGTTTSRTARLIITRPSSQKIVVSGNLYNYEGTPVGYKEPVKMDIVVKLFPSFTSDSVIYTESFLTENNNPISVSKGEFIVRLGDGLTDDNLREVIQQNSNIFVSFLVTPPGGSFEMLDPRTPLTASPYSLSGAAEILKGLVDPTTAGIEAAIGTHYVNISTGQTFLRVYNGWVEMSDQ